jgi:hypothetical protein
MTKTTYHMPAGRQAKPASTYTYVLPIFFPKNKKITVKRCYLLYTHKNTSSTMASPTRQAPAPPPFLVTPIMLMLWLLLASSHTRGAMAATPNTEALSVLCNGASYGAGDPFATSLTFVLSELLSATPVRAGHDFYDISPYPAAFAYGHAACRAALSAADCAACLRSAVSQMDASCGHSVGARAVLVDCSVRYEQYAFVD